MLSCFPSALSHTREACSKDSTTQHRASVRLGRCWTSSGSRWERPAPPSAHFAAAHGAHTLHQLPRLQLEGPAALHLLVPQFHSTSFFGPEKDQELSTLALILRLPRTLRCPLSLSSPQGPIPSSPGPAGQTLWGGPFHKP